MRHQIQVAEFPTINKCNNLLAGISAVVGVIGGVCLLTSAAKTLIDKIGERRFIGKGPADNHNCHACSCAIQQLDSNSFVTCSLCNKRICRSAKCSKWMPNSGGWECQICNLAKDSLTQTQSWVAEQMSFNHQKFVYPMRARSEIYIPIGDSKESSLHFESVSQVNLNSAAITAEQKLKIREYVEEVVSNLLGGSLDQVRISQLSKSENYLPSIINTNAIPQSLVASNNSQSNDIPNVNMPPEFAGVSQMRLRHMIESIIAEMLHLPSLTNGAGTSDVDHNMDAPDNEIAMTMSLEKENIGIRHRHKNYFEPKIYHDLLATAVLNKISDKEGNIRQFSESTPDLSITNIDSNFNVENQSTTSGSSVEPMSDISYTDTEQSPKISKVFGRESVLSDYIAAHTVPLPDLSAAATESEDDHASISSSILAEGTWEDNWLFKKKRSSLTTSMTGSIGMLVPAPKNDIRAQIGDKTADEISDLSEIGSDTDESSANMDSANLDPLNNRILNKQLIGGKNTKEALDELIETTSLISNTSAALNEPKYTETRNEYVVETASKIEATNPNIVNHSAQEAQMISVNPEKRGEQNPLSGSIAEREYKKWNNAVEMPNNPYAPEALKRRISGSQERFMDLPNINLSTDNNPISLIKTTRAEEEVKGECCSDIDYKRYSRDYYINDDKGPKTSPKRQVVTNDSYRLHPNVSDDPMEDIAINENLNEQNVTHEIETPIEPHSMVYQALPAQVVEETASIETISNQSIQSVNTTTSDDSDTVRIYDFKKQQTTTVRNLDKTPASTKGESIAEGSIEPKLQPTATISTSMEDSPPKGQHPTQLPLEANVNSSIVIETQPAITPTRSSTPMAFKFLQPKRRLIDPSQILSLDEGADALTISPPGEKAVVEEELAQVMPSVKALAQAFLLSSNKCSHGETRWKKRLQNMPALSGKSHTKQEPMKKTEASLSIAEIAEDATIASDLSSLETDPPTNKDLFAAKSSEGLTSVPLLATTPPSNPATNVEGNRSATTNALRRVSLLKSNIAFFENLKFK